MIRLSIVFAAFMFAFNLLATQVAVIPNIKPDCSREEDDYIRLNRVANVVKTDNFERGEVVIEFYTDHGRCVDGEYKTLKIQENAHLTFWKEGINYPWTKYPFTSDIELLDDKTAKVTIVFDLAKLFKKEDVRKFDYWFTPEENAHYGWHIVLEKTPAGEIRVLLKQK